MNMNMKGKAKSKVVATKNLPGAGKGGSAMAGAGKNGSAMAKLSSMSRPKAK